MRLWRIGLVPLVFWLGSQALAQAQAPVRSSLSGANTPVPALPTPTTELGAAVMPPPPLPEPEPAPGADARALKSRLTARGFQCGRSSGGGFATCVGTLPPDSRGPVYSEPVAIIVPPSWHPRSRIVLHLHGFVMGIAIDRTPQAILDYFNFPHLLLTGGRLDWLLVVPFSKGTCTTYKDELTPRFERWMGQLTLVLGLSAPVQLTLSGHSGASFPIRSILDAAETDDARYARTVDSVFLLDSTYRYRIDPSGEFLPFDTTPYVSLMSRKGAPATPRVFCAYRGQTDTEPGALLLRGALGTESEVLQADTHAYPEAADHWGLVKAYFPKFIRELQ